MSIPRLALMNRAGALLLVIATTLAAVFPVSAPAADKKKEEKKEVPQYKVSGRDPRAFVDAQALLALPTRRPAGDEEAKALLAALAGAWNEKAPWAPPLWAQLDGLRGLSLSDAAVAELRNAAGEVKVQDRAPQPPKAAAARQAFLKGNGHYEAGRFDKAIESYRAALKEHPAFWDAWNNAALSEMHDGNDLAALFILSALIRNNPKYAGGAINLSVCLVRLGQAGPAYDTAAAVAEQQPQMPMALYNMAWLENARGNHDAAQDRLTKALESVSDYPVAKWLRAINKMEAGRVAGDWDLKALRSEDQPQGVPTIVVRQVGDAPADAYSEKIVVDRIPPGTPLLISEKAGDWNAVYRVAGDVKHRLWVHQANLNPLVALADIKPFLGTWKGSWGRFYLRNVGIDHVNGSPKVTLPDHEIRDEKLEKGKLSFRAKAAGSGEEFTYTLVQAQGDLRMDVLRMRDNQRFSGKLSK